MNYWLLKSEPDVWSIDQQMKSGSKRCDMGWCKKLSSSKQFKENEKKVIYVFFITQILEKKLLV